MALPSILAIPSFVAVEIVRSSATSVPESSRLSGMTQYQLSHIYDNSQAIHNLWVFNDVMVLDNLSVLPAALPEEFRASAIA
jgi:hypothetical protein